MLLHHTKLTFLQNIMIQLFVRAERRQLNRLKRNAHLQINGRLFARPFNFYPRIPKAHNMRANAGYELVLGAHVAGVALLERRLHAQMLCISSTALCDPLQQPLVGLVSARHLQRYHVVAAQQNNGSLQAATSQCSSCANGEQTKAGSEEIVVGQTGYHFAERHRGDGGCLSSDSAQADSALYKFVCS